jgi:hypothetical protein
MTWYLIKNVDNFTVSYLFAIDKCGILKEEYRLGFSRIICWVVIGWRLKEAG